MTDAKVPGFLVIGAAKSGTTSLFSHLAQHPQIHTSHPKEPRFFAVDGGVVPEHGAGWLIDTWERYLGLFSGARPGQVCGEASTGYLHSAGVIERVHARIPDVRLVAILRHPAEAAWSHYLMARRNRETHDAFEALIAREPLDPVAAPWEPRPVALVRSRLYHAHLTRWLAVFPREQLLVHLHEDLRVDPEAVLRRTFAHLGVDPGVPVWVTEPENVGSNPRLIRLHTFDERPGRAGRLVKATLRHAPGRRTVQDAVNRWNRRPPPPMPAAARRQLLDLFREDTSALERLLDRDLSAWKR